MQYLLLCTLICLVSARFHFKPSVKNDNRVSKQALLNSSNINEPEVLIIGAGLSGLEAARLLKQNNIRTLVIEARNRIGGRIHSIKSKDGHVFDLGAAWIHGCNGSIPHGFLSNPLCDIVQEAEIPTRSTDVKDIQLFNVFDQNITESMSTWFDDYMDYVNEMTKNSVGNESMQYYADLFSRIRKFTQEQQYAFDTYLHVAVEGNEGAEVNKINAKNFITNTGTYYGLEPIFHDTGYHAIIDYLVKDFEDDDIHLEQIVNKISYDRDLVEVHTTNGRVYRTKYVVLTIPLGVLKGRQIEFDPPLPSWKSNAIDHLGYGLLNKVILIWDKAWWNSSNYYFVRVASKSNPFRVLVNANKWNDRPALICLFIGDEANRLETTLTKEQVVDELLNALKRMYPNRTIPMPIDSYVTRWKSDPFSNGSYSYVSVNQTYDDMVYIGQPVAHQLFFAGEATSKEFYGFAHGALLSGRREATRLLFNYDLVPTETIPVSTSTATDSFKNIIMINVILWIFLFY